MADAYGKSHGGEPWRPWEAGFEHGATVKWSVGTSLANPFGLHDVHGNVWEWCLDGFQEYFYYREPREDPVGQWEGVPTRIDRGGGLYLLAEYARSANLHDYSPTYKADTLGVRPARAIDP